MTYYVKQSALTATAGQQLDQHQLDFYQAATDSAISMLSHYGNTLNQAHKDSIRSVMEHFCFQLFGICCHRVALPLSAGMGKTTCAIALIQTIEEWQLDKSVIVCANRVETLCEILRELTCHNVPRQRIALLHSYEYDANYNGHEPGYKKASEPSDGHSAITHRPYLLMTHNKVYASQRDALDVNYAGRARDLIIWDESIQPDAGHAIVLEVIADQLSASQSPLNRFATSTGQSDYTHVNTFVTKTIQALDQAESSMASGKDLQFVSLPELPLSPGSAIGAFKGALRQSGIRMDGDQVLRLMQWAKLQKRPRLLGVRGKQCLAVCTKQVPDQFQNIAVLDASFPIRSLSMADTSFSLANGIKPKDYSDVTMHFHKYSSGLDSRKRELTRPESPIAEETALIIETAIQKEEAVSVLLHKEIGAKPITDALKRRGNIDLERAEAGNNRLLNFLTWGTEISSNDYVHCKHVLVFSVWHKPLESVAANLFAAKGDQCTEITEDEIIEAELREQVHHIYQGISRGSCRLTENGKAAPMQVYLFHMQPDALRGHLDVAMPGAQWLRYEPKYLKAKTQKAQSAEVIKRLLGYRLSKEDPNDCVSTIELFRHQDLQPFSDSTKGDSLQDVLANSNHFYKPEGKRSIYRNIQK